MSCPSTDSCDWALKEDIQLETRVGDDGEVEYWAYTHLDGFEVFSLAHVEPLISEPEIPHIMTYTEGANAQAISPWLDLKVKEDNEWNVKYPSLRVRSMSISVDEGYIKGEDILKLPEVPGFESAWDEEHGVLTVSAIPGFEFTEDTMADYEDGQVELVDVTEVINTVEASAKLTDFREVLRMVQFETTSGGTLSRKMSLSANELLTSDSIATITMATLINTPDPPEVIPSPDALVYKEKAPLTPLDSNVEVCGCPGAPEHGTHCCIAIVDASHGVLVLLLLLMSRIPVCISATGASPGRQRSPGSRCVDRTGIQQRCYDVPTIVSTP